MPSLTRKFVKGRPYYYVRHCQRVDGQPKIVKTTYLGSLDQILQSLHSAHTPPPPQTAEVLAFGDVAALYEQALELDLVRLVDAQRCWRAIQEILLIYPKAVGEKNPRTATCLSAMADEQPQLFDLLNLSRYQRA